MAFSEQLDINQAYYGLVIGPGGSNIRRLRQMPGVTLVEFNTRGNFGPSTPLIIWGRSQDACAAARHDVAQRIYSKDKISTLVPQTSRLYLPSGITNGRIVVRKETLAWPGAIQVAIGRPNNFFIAAIENLTTRGIRGSRDPCGDSNPHGSRRPQHLAERLEELGINNELQPRMLNYSFDDAVAAVAQSLTETPDLDSLDLIVLAGQEMFGHLSFKSAPDNIDLPIHGGCMRDIRGLKPYFNSFPEASLKQSLVENLLEQGYSLATTSWDGHPSSYTLVFLWAEPEQKVATVILSTEEKDLQAGDLEPAVKIALVKVDRRKLCTLTQVTAAGLDVRASIRACTITNEEVLPERIREVLQDCWQNRDCHGRIADPPTHTGISFRMVKQVTSLQCFTKETVCHGHNKLIEVGITDMWKKDGRQDGYLHCIEVGLKLIGDNKDAMKEQRQVVAEKIVRDWEHLRDAWYQLAAGL